MAEVFRDADRKRTEPVERQLPTIQREQRELHSHLDTLGRASRYLRTPTESTRVGGVGSVARASNDMAIVSRVQGLLPEGSQTLASRLQGALENSR